MTFVLDANILLRSAEPTHTQYAQATDAVRVLTRRNHSLVIVPQNLYEFWAVATRPVKDNGLGMTPAEADAELAGIEARFPPLPDTPAVLPVWRLVVAHAVRGKPTHDARLTAALLVHGVADLLTFNASHFKRFQPAVTAHHPADVLASPP